MISFYALKAILWNLTLKDDILKIHAEDKSRNVGK
jgi:hypothetical protein